MPDRPLFFSLFDWTRIMDAYFTIIGGGGGLSIAWGLAHHRHRVIVLDAGALDFRDSRGNFGLVWGQGKGCRVASATLSRRRLFARGGKTDSRRRHHSLLLRIGHRRHDPWICTSRMPRAEPDEGFRPRRNGSLSGQVLRLDGQ